MTPKIILTGVVVIVVTTAGILLYAQQKKIDRLQEKIIRRDIQISALKKEAEAHALQSEIEVKKADSIQLLRDENNTNYQPLSADSIEKLWTDNWSYPAR